MKPDFLKYGQYKNDIFVKMNIDFKKDKKLLDVGCGDGTDIEIFISEFKLDVYGIDICERINIKNIKKFKFQKAGIHKIPFQDCSFDYIFLHDVLHHIDEKKQSYVNHVDGLKELKRVCRKGGCIIILEANRYNPLLYPYMTLLKGHNHFKRSYFMSLVKDVFSNVRFKFFECHFYPKKFEKFWKIYEKIIESTVLFKPFLAYNLAIIIRD